MGIGSSLSAQVPGAGAPILGRASINFTDTASGYHSLLDSNIVASYIQPQEVLQLSEGQTLYRQQGNLVLFTHHVINKGNASSICSFQVANQPSNDFRLDSVTLVLDVNSNGIPDSGEPTLHPDDSIRLEPGASLDLVIQAVVPLSAPSGSSACLALKATTQRQQISVESDDTVHIVESTALQISKEASTLDPQPGGEVGFSITATSVWEILMPGVTSFVDGAPQSLVLIRDPLPANTSLKSVQPSAYGQLLYHIISSPERHYTATLPADLSQVDEIALGVPSLNKGQALKLNFAVSINPNASGTISNVAQGIYSGSGNQVQVMAYSNQVMLRLPSSRPTLAFYANDSFLRVTGVARLDSPLFVRLVAAEQNLDPSHTDTALVTLSSKMTGDREQLYAVETGPNTGIFSILPGIATRNAGQYPAEAGNRILETQVNDTITAVFVQGDTPVSASAVVSPYGVVFDSHTNQPISGARVRLLDVTGVANGGNPGGLAKVYQSDGVTEAPAEVVTGADGQFQFPVLEASTYRIEVVPPLDLIYPSRVTPMLMPKGRRIDSSASYGSPFQIMGSVGSFCVDIPLDAPPPSGLFVEKTSSRQTAEIADVIDYRVRIRNNGDSLFEDVALTDNLPAGFSYVSGSARLNGNALEDPSGNAGPRLVFQVGDIAVGKESVLTYRVKVGPGALQGDGTNRAQAQGTTVYGTSYSNEASAQVKLEPGVFTENGIILGRVFVDSNHNGIQDKKEPGIPGVRLYIEDGSFIITDSEGKYSFYGVSPRSHVLKLDRTSLPAGARLKPVSIRNAKDAGSVFVDIKTYETRKVNFAEVSASPAVLKEVQARKEVLQKRTTEESRMLSGTLRVDESLRNQGDLRALPSSGLMGEDVSFESIAEGTQLSNANSNLPPSPVKPTPTFEIEQVLPTQSNEVGFINLRDRDTLPMAQTDVWVKGARGCTFSLTVNGTPISKDRVGQISILDEKQLESWDFVGVALKPGPNTLTVQQIDSFGNARGSASVNVIAPGKLGKIKLVVPNDTLPADGKTPVAIQLLLTDDQDVPVCARTPVTLEATDGQWDLSDLNPSEPGVQIFVENGSANLALISPSSAVDCKLRASSGLMEGMATLHFIPELRPMIAVGILEGSIRLNHFNWSALSPARSEDGFENELRAIARSGDLTAGGRAALYLKGKIKGSTLLTLAYDSERDDEKSLFRDIKPDDYYPIYGDSSVRGYDAQSTSQLYLKLEQNKTYLLVGDYTTWSNQQVRTLGVYSRSLTGVQTHLESGFGELNLFASHDRSRQIVEEVSANGTSGPYYLSTTGFLENSERIDILVRDRNQPAMVLSTQSQTRFVDYEIEPLSGRILFRRPIPSLDANLNPISIRVSYEVEQGGPRFWVTGVDGQIKLNPVMEIGGSWVQDRNPLDRMKLTSINLTLKLGAYTYLIGERAYTEHEETGRGIGQRVELVHEDSRLKARAYTAKTDPGFDNPMALLNQGRSESGIKGTYLVSDRTRFTTEALWTKANAESANRVGLSTSFEHTLLNGVQLELGVRHGEDPETQPQPQPSQLTSSADATGVDFTSMRGKLSFQPPSWPQASFYGEYEQDLKDASKRVLAAGGDYQISNRGRLYARHEIISSLMGRYTLNSNQTQNTTVVGLDTDYLKSAHLFSEYRVKDAFSGRDAEAAIGLRNSWSVAPGVSLSGSFEKVHTLKGPDDGDSVAVTSAVEYTQSQNWKGTARVEYRNGTNSDSFLSTFGMVRKINTDWSLLARDAFNIMDSDGDVPSERRLNRLQVGMAYRPVDSDTWNGLLRYELKTEKDDTQKDFALDRVAHIFTGDVNYQPNPKHTYSARYAMKLAHENTNAIDTDTTAHLLGTRMDYEWKPRISLSLLGNMLLGENSNQRQYGLGGEVGFLVGKNMLLGIGYNVVGFRDDDLAEENYTSQGVYLRLRYKLDEEFFLGGR